MDDMMTERAARQAAQWYARLGAPDCTAADREAFERWRREPAHAEAFAAAERLADSIGALAAADPRLREMAAAACASSFEEPSSPEAHVVAAPRHPWVAAALAASVVAAATLWALPRHLPMTAPAVVYATAATEQRRIELDDGTAIHLDVGSELEVRMTGSERRVALTAGRAIFDVAHDPRRPFAVRAGGAVVTALGTRFQVEQARGRVMVTLAEGAVAVTGEHGGRERLQPGERLQLTAGSSAAWIKDSVDPRAATSWSHGRHVFRSVPLRDALDEINRYAAKKVRIGEPTLADLPVSGNFAVGDSESIVAAFTAVLPIDRAEAAGEIVLVRNPSGDR